jgi:hypothetical protein
MLHVVLQVLMLLKHNELRAKAMFSYHLPIKPVPMLTVVHRPAPLLPPPDSQGAGGSGP